MYFTISELGKLLYCTQVARKRNKPAQKVVFLNYIMFIPDSSYYHAMQIGCTLHFRNHSQKFYRKVIFPLQLPKAYATHWEMWISTDPDSLIIQKGLLPPHLACICLGLQAL